ncbi:MAG: hypothetical protein AAB415_00365 [Patescibacteria group bacterium]
MTLFEININNSFNKKVDDTHNETVVGNDSTLNKNLGNNTEISALNVASLTSSVVGNQTGFTIGDIKRKTLIREILVGATGSVMGSIITLIITNFLR